MILQAYKKLCLYTVAMHDERVDHVGAALQAPAAGPAEPVAAPVEATVVEVSDAPMRLGRAMTGGEPSLMPMLETWRSRDMFGPGIGIDHGWCMALGFHTH